MVCISENRRNWNELERIGTKLEKNEDKIKLTIDKHEKMHLIRA